jgi:hypothetical protein
MTDPRDPGAAPPPEAGHDPPRHGLVEEIREEIGEAVEHVPAPVRWTVARLAWAIGLSVVAVLVLLLVSGVLYVVNRTEWVAKELTVFVNQTLSRRSDVVLEMRDIKGNPLTGLRILSPRVRFREGDFPPLVEATQMKLGYSALGLVNGRGPIVIELERPIVRLAREPSGRLRLPQWRAAPSAKGPGRGYDVQIVIRDGALRVPEPLEGIEGLELAASVATGARTRAEIHRLTWRSGPYGTRLERLRADYAEGDTVRLAIRELRTQDLTLQARAAWASGGAERLVHLRVDRVRWAWLARVFRNGAFDVPGEGRFVAHARGNRQWRGDFAAGLDWNGLPVRGRGGFSTDGKRWTVSPLDAESPAGDLAGRFEYAADGWEVAGEARRGDPARWGAIGIPGWPAGRLNGWFRYGVDRRKHGRLAARLTGSEIAGWRADSATVGVDFPANAPDSFTVAMRRRGGEMMLLGASTAGGWRGRYTLAGLPLDEWPDGKASGLAGLLDRGEGNVQGAGGELRVTGTLEGRSTDWLGARMGRWRLEGVSGRLLPTPDLEARALLRDVTFLGVHFDTAGTVFRLGDREADLLGVEARASDTTLAAAGHVSWGDDRWSLDLERAEAKSGQFHWIADPPVLLSGDGHGVTFDRLLARDGGASLAIAGRWAGPGGVYDWTARGEGLDLARLGFPTGWGLSGTADLELRVAGMSGDPRWTFRGSARAPGAGGHRADSLALSLGGGPHRLDLDGFSVAIGSGTLAGRARVEGTVAPWPDALTGDAVVRWLADAAQCGGEFRATAFPLERLESVAPSAAGWTGRLDGTVALSGSPRHPEIHLAAGGQPLAWRDYRVDQATVRATYKDEHLDVEEIRMARGNVVSTAAGVLPLKLALGEPAVLPEAPISGHVDLPGGDLAVLPLFVPQIGSASGRFALSAVLAGTARHPKLNGSLQVRNGVVRLAGREEVLEGVHADFRLDESRLTLDSLAARQGTRGRVRGSGALELSGLALRRYRFDLALRDFAAVESGLYAAEFDGDFVVTNGPRVNGATLPQVEGNVEVQRAVVLFDFAKQSETQLLAATTQPLFWTYRIQLSATSNLHWQPPDGDIEFSADLTLEQTPDSLIIYGDMRSLRGSYNFLYNRFNVLKADLTFDNLNGVNPVVDAEATTRVVPVVPVAADNSGGTDRPHQVTVKITGRANEPVASFSSDIGDWDEPRILRELTVNRFVKGAWGSQGDPLDNYVTRAINNALSAELQRAFKGYINEWVLERERGGLLYGQGEVIVGVGIPVARNLQVRYRQRLPGFSHDYGPINTATTPFERDVEAEYRLNRFIFVTTELTQRRIVSGSPNTAVGAPDFNLNLKARWEY